MAIDTGTLETRAETGTEPRPYRIRPLRGQVLVRLLPFEYAGLLVLPDTLPLFVDGEGKKLPRKALVIAIGPWRTTKQGLSILPDFHPGQRVLVSEYFGSKLTRNFGEEFRLCRVDDVLAVLEEELTAPDRKA